MKLPIGTTVRRVSNGCIGDGSIGIITSYGIDSKCYWVEIIHGMNKMEGWKTDAWCMDWCEPIAYTHTADWEV